MREKTQFSLNLDLQDVFGKGDRIGQAQTSDSGIKRGGEKDQDGGEQTDERAGAVTVNLKGVKRG